jgi:hypothetical protein
MIGMPGRAGVSLGLCLSYAIKMNESLYAETM